MRRPNSETYRINGIETMYSPSLVYFYDTIIENTKQVISIARDPAKLWPHIKTHKMLDMLLLQIQMGITKFKCSTITELETAARAGAHDALFSYPLVGPNIGRFIRLQKKYPAVRLWATGDNADCFAELSLAAAKEGLRINAVIDVNAGMNRTGVRLGPDTVRLYETVASLPGVELRGLHCYDGHIHDGDRAERERKVQVVYDAVCSVRNELRARSLKFDTVIAGGTPSFPCYARIADEDFYYSPGTVFVYDFGYYSQYADLNLIPAAVIVSRVVSTPSADTFTLDTGYKAIASDPVKQRGLIVEFPEAQSVSQNEEHWIFKKSAGMELPKVGTVVRIIPTHICPTTALYPFAYLVKDGSISGKWEITARNRE